MSLLFNMLSRLVTAFLPRSKCLEKTKYPHWAEPGFKVQMFKIMGSRWWSWRRQWQPTPVLLPGKPRGRRSLVGCSPGLRRVGHDWSNLAAAAAAANDQGKLKKKKATYSDTSEVEERGKIRTQIPWGSACVFFCQKATGCDCFQICMGKVLCLCITRLSRLWNSESETSKRNGSEVNWPFFSMLSWITGSLGHFNSLLRVKIPIFLSDSHRELICHGKQVPNRVVEFVSFLWWL